MTESHYPVSEMKPSSGVRLTDPVGFQLRTPGAVVQTPVVYLTNPFAVVN